jgi:hypothetical protein
VVGRLDGVIRPLPRSDGIRVFAEMYRDVTELVGARLAEGRFANDEFVETLDVIFAELFLDVPQALASRSPVEKAWQPLVERRGEPLFPVQFALAGMNAHINHDLAVAVVHTCGRLGLTPDTRGLRADYDQVNAILAERVRPIRQAFLDEIVVRYGSSLSPLADIIGNFSIEKAREAAWISAETLWAVRGIPLVRDHARATLSRTIGLVSRQLLVPFDPLGQLSPQG